MIKKIIALLGLVLFQYMVSKAQSTGIYMPLPAHMEKLDGKFAIHSEFSTFVEGPTSERVRSAVQRFQYRLSSITRMSINWYEYNTHDQPSLSIVYQNSVAQAHLGMDESYRISIDPDAGILLQAPTDIGIVRGLETLLQSLEWESSEYFFPMLEIYDGPRFPWRGLMLDVCRHFMPIDRVKSIIDGMVVAKLNVLHWHLSEDQGFRVESKKFPRLHELGSDGLYYTHDQIREVIYYADIRGIRVMPEFDMPGHTTAWMVGHPELASAPGPYTIERFFGVFDPTMDPTSENTYQFLTSFLEEMSTLFTDEYLHIGGDENNGVQWDQNESIQRFMKDKQIENNHQLQAYFNQRILHILEANGKKMMGWDEILEEGISKDIVIHSWRGKDQLVTAAKNGYKTVLSNGYYIDLSQPASFHYTNDPLPADSPLDPMFHSNILGGEATMWSELVSAGNVETRIWPRTLAIAERLWSPLDVNDVPNMYERLFKMEDHLELAGSYHRKNRNALILQIAGKEEASLLEYLLDWLEPLDGYRRHGSQPRYTSYTPLTRPVDATYPDAIRAVKFGIVLQRLHSHFNQSDYQFLKNELKDFKEKSKSFEAFTEQNHLLNEIQPLVAALITTMSIIEELVENINNKKLTNNLRLTYIDKINELNIPAGELELGITPWVLETLKTNGKD